MQGRSKLVPPLPPHCMLQARVAVTCTRLSLQKPPGTVTHHTSSEQGQK